MRELKKNYPGFGVSGYLWEGGSRPIIGKFDK